MEDALGRGRYVKPHVVDHGDLIALTSAMHLLYGSTADPSRDMSFSGATSGGGGGTTAAGGVSPVTASGATTPATGDVPAGVQNVTTTAGGGSVPSGTTGTAGGGGTVGAGAGGGVGGGGGGLPFTGFPAAAVAAVGTGLVATGVALRRAVRPKRTE
jgi:hypothetical protein